MKLLGIVILYYPDAGLHERIATYAPVCERVLLWENTPNAVLPPSTDSLVYMTLGYNAGLGAPLNAAADYARQHGYTHLICFDQDSYFSEAEAHRYIRRIEEYGADKQVIFSTNYHLVSRRTTYYPVSHGADTVASSMTSGTVYPLAVISQLGRFNEDLFVWGIDMEYAFRAQQAGIPTLCFKDILLQHDLGYQRREYRLLGKTVSPNEYSPARSYYNVRNGFLLHRLYPNRLSLRQHLKYHFFKRMAFVWLYEQEKLAKTHALLKGFYHGIRQRTGKL